MSVALQTRASAEFLPRSFVDGACDVLALGPSVFGGVGGGGYLKPNSDQVLFSGLIIENHNEEP